MAVSSSIGSNIFDILVGLPLPWLAYALIYDKPVFVEADNLEASILVLLAMLVVVIATIMYNKWILTKQLGFCMFVFYVLFLIQDLARANWDCI
eukprot:UN02249